MYVLVIGRAYPSPETGMMGIFEYEQAKAISKAGCKTVYTFCDTRSIKLLKRYGYIGLENKKTPVYGYHLPIGGAPRTIFSKIKNWYYNRLFKEIISKHGLPDIIHIHFPLLTLTEEVFDNLKGLKIPIVVTEHWTRVQTKKILPYHNKLLKRLVSEVDEFITVSDQLKDSVIELTNTNRNILVVPNMVSSLFYYEDQKVTNEPFKFIAAGRLVEVKRFDLIIEAFAKTFADNKNVHLVIAGDGPLYEKLSRQIELLKMSDRIFMLGFLTREETAKTIRKSDAFVSASVLETFGVPFIEAMECGKPVIGTQDVPIAKYINKTNGILFKTDDLEDLCESLKFVYENRISYNGKMISDNSHEIFGEESVSNILLDIYENTLA